MYTEAFNEGYREGYKEGYEWLTRGNNFHHPNNHGYIPGGPYIFTANRYDKPEYKVKAQKSLENNRGWIKGWIDGINAYVTDNKLSYGMVEYPFDLRGYML